MNTTGKIETAGLVHRSEEEQMNLLIYIMGDRADNISFKLSIEEMKRYDTVKGMDKFKTHFEKKTNIIYKRAKFNQRK